MFSFSFSEGNKKLAIEEQRLAVDAANKADQTEIAKQRLVVEAADKADKTDIAEMTAVSNAMKRNTKGNQ